MPNGNCPVGAALTERVAGMARELEKLEACAQMQDEKIDRNTRSIDKLIWQVSLGAAVGAAILAPLVRWLMDMIIPGGG